MFSLITAVTFFGCGKHGYKGLSTLTAGAASSDKSKEELEKENEQLKRKMPNSVNSLLTTLTPRKKMQSCGNIMSLKGKSVIRHSSGRCVEKGCKR